MGSKSRVKMAKKEEKMEEPQNKEEVPKKKGKMWGDPLIIAE